MATERGLDRIVFFSDAVVAIAITLLILPLVDSVPEAAKSGEDVTTFLAGNASQVLGFVISFWVIARLWRAHHGVFRHVRAHTPLLMNLSLFWTFTIAVLPLPTAIISEFASDRPSVGLYIGVMALSSLTLSIMTVLVSRNPEVQDPEEPVTRLAVVGSVTTSSLFLVVFVVGIATASLWPLFLLLLTGPIVDVFRRRQSRTSGSATPVSPPR
jgi:uncharacterized membrane protein